MLLYSHSHSRPSSLISVFQSQRSQCIEDESAMEYWDLHICFFFPKDRLRLKAQNPACLTAVWAKSGP
ncbi:hypothetical protein RchiOBHm_Chr2g0159051 [Rosa chinensis]|uniref:Uncharacterized protein n=1 Tax=Rosa chinensis TaxID=74649 RepID=A0A2P6S285_ROSCH|nr:hypothetical protein RchiOBHm_Chr2g0159051 [Rosa chinensis]